LPANLPDGFYEALGITPIDENWFRFDVNDWTGYLKKGNFDSNGNYLSLGPIPPGMYSGIEAVLVFAMLKKFAETPKGQTLIRDIIRDYLKTIGGIVESLHDGGKQNWLTGLVNSRVSCAIYERLGLMSPMDATQNKAWIDHQIGEEIFTQRMGQGIQGVTTLVGGTKTDRYTKTTGSSGAGLGAIAKMLGKT
jgi:hypothetical protein